MNAEVNFENRKAWVVFTNQSELKSVRMLKKGFRHCFVVFKDKKRWVSLDPMANYTDVNIHDLPEDFDFISFLEDSGHIAVRAKIIRGIKTSAPINIFTCVEVCKRFLGLHKVTIITPWQLYKYLKNN